MKDILYLLALAPCVVFSVGCAWAVFELGKSLRVLALAALHVLEDE